MFGTKSSQPLFVFPHDSPNDTSQSGYVMKATNVVSVDQQSGLMEDHNWVGFALQRYLQTGIVSPLVVVETLTDVQFQERDDESEEEKKGLLPRLQGGIAQNLKDITDSEPAGGFAMLFKGHTTDFAFRLSFAAIQPYLEELMNDAMDVLEDTHPVTHIVSHALTGAVLSPLELVRTRLIAQSTQSHKRRYFGPLHALYAIANEERPSNASTAISTLYSVQLLLPSILIHSIGPSLRFVLNRFIQDELGLDATFNPLLFRLATLGVLAIQSLVQTPLEMARKRLQLQRIDALRKPVDSTDGYRQKPFETCVETQPEAYTGITHCIWSIMQREGGVKSRKRRTFTGNETINSDWSDIYGGGNEASRSSNTFVGRVGGVCKGISTLYRGFWANYCSSIILYVSNDILNEEPW